MSEQLHPTLVGRVDLSRYRTAMNPTAGSQQTSSYYAPTSNHLTTSRTSELFADLAPPPEPASYYQPNVHFASREGQRITAINPGGVAHSSDPVARSRTRAEAEQERLRWLEREQGDGEERPNSEDDERNPFRDPPEASSSRSKKPLSGLKKMFSKQSPKPLGDRTPTAKFV